MGSKEHFLPLEMHRLEIRREPRQDCRWKQREEAILRTAVVRRRESVHVRRQLWPVPPADSTRAHVALVSRRKDI